MPRSPEPALAARSLLFHLAVVAHMSGRTPVAGAAGHIPPQLRRRHLGALTRLPGPTDRTARNARRNDSKLDVVDAGSQSRRSPFIARLPCERAGGGGGCRWGRRRLLDRRV